VVNDDITAVARAGRLAVALVVGATIWLVLLVAGFFAPGGWTWGMAGPVGHIENYSRENEEPWPAFVMVYRETAYGLGLNGAPGTQRFRLEYTDRHHFRTTLISNSALPSAVGSTWTFAGHMSTVHDAVHAYDQVNTFGADGVTVPAEWLVPGRIQELSTRPGYTVREAGNGQSVLAHTDTYSGHSDRQELTFRPADGIPTHVVDTVDGEVRREIVVEELTFQPSANS
jgi:hypothetical protein